MQFDTRTNAHILKIFREGFFMFSYYGSKSKIVDYYPPPKHKKIIEPFAGSARYSLKYWQNDVLLVEKFEKVFKIWEYLKNASKQDIMNLPDVITDLREMNLSDAEKYLIGYCIGRGSARPRNINGKFNNWATDKIRIANDIHKIKHWQILKCDYTDIENEKATWFIDPPYKVQVHGYNCKIDDYIKLAEWCKERNGQIMVCENENGDWLPFKPLKKLNGINKQTTEYIWTNEKEFELF